MSRRKWLWLSLAAIPLVTAAALAASAVGAKQTPQVQQVETATEEPCCSGPECCKDCPPDCPPEACPFCIK